MEITEIGLQLLVNNILGISAKLKLYVLSNSTTGVIAQHSQTHSGEHRSLSVSGSQSSSVL